MRTGWRRAMSSCRSQAPAIASPRTSRHQGTSGEHGHQCRHRRGVRRVSQRFCGACRCCAGHAPRRRHRPSASRHGAYRARAARRPADRLRVAQGPFTCVDSRSPAPLAGRLQGHGRFALQRRKARPCFAAGRRHRLSPQGFFFARSRRPDSANCTSAAVPSPLIASRLLARLALIERDETPAKVTLSGEDGARCSPTWPEAAAMPKSRASSEFPRIRK